MDREAILTSLRLPAHRGPQDSPLAFLVRTSTRRGVPVSAFCTYGALPALGGESVLRPREIYWPGKTVARLQLPDSQRAVWWLWPGLSLARLPMPAVHTDISFPVHLGLSFPPIGRRRSSASDEQGAWASAGRPYRPHRKCSTHGSSAADFAHSSAFSLTGTPPCGQGIDHGRYPASLSEGGNTYASWLGLGSSPDCPDAGPRRAWG